MFKTVLAAAMFALAPGAFAATEVYIGVEGALDGRRVGRGAEQPDGRAVGAHSPGADQLVETYVGARV